jgi:hypothetical protein
LARERIAQSPFDIVEYAHRFPMNEEEARTKITIDSSVQTASADFWTPRLLFEALPNSKLILRVRQSSSRLNSDWYYSSKQGDPNVILPRLIERLIYCLKVNEEQVCASQPHLYLLTKGLYIIIIERWLRVFPKSQLLILPMEMSTEQAVQDAVNFLELNHREGHTHAQTNSQKQYANKGASYPRFDPSLVTILEEFYRPFNQRLVDFLQNHELQSEESVVVAKSYVINGDE